MSDVLAQFGVAGDNLVTQGRKIRQRDNKKVAHIDGDFIAYQIAADTRDEKDGIRPMRSLEYKLAQIEDVATEIMERAGCGRYVLHVTPSGSTKGNRPQQAIQKEYQANRLGRDKPEHLDVIRAAIAEARDHKFGKGLAHLDQEADDGIVQANIADLDNAVLCSRDKDLRMSPGWHMDMDTDELIFIEPDDFGFIDIEEKISESGKSKTKKLVGYGPKFFWAQCLMGDTADNIAGLPIVSGYSKARLRDGDAFIKDVQSVKEGTDTQKNRIKAKWVKSKTCGAVGAFDLLYDLDNNKDAYNRVKDLFIEANKFGGHEYKHWKTGNVVTPTQALLGDMQLLWMRHTRDQNDVIRWLKTFV